MCRPPDHRVNSAVLKRGPTSTFVVRTQPTRRSDTCPSRVRLAFPPPRHAHGPHRAQLCTRPLHAAVQYLAATPALPPRPPISGPPLRHLRCRIEPVSNTHLRAPETKANLVCRLL